MNENQFLISCLRDEDFIGVKNALNFGADISYQDFLAIRMAKWAVDNGHENFKSILKYLEDFKNADN